MADEPKRGDHLTWRSHRGEAEGEVERRITSDTEAGGRTVRATKDDPQYLVRSDASGGEAVHTASALQEQETERPGPGSSGRP